MRAILQTVNVLVPSEQFALGRAHEAFDEVGGLKDAKRQTALAVLAKRLVEVGAKLAA